MFIKLLCVKTTTFDGVVYGEKQFTIEEGTTVGAMISRNGIHFEFEPNHYSLPYYFEDVAKSFISALDEESYDKIYKKVKNCKMYLEDGTVINLGNVRVTMEELQ